MQSIQFFYENFDWKVLREVVTDQLGCGVDATALFRFVRKSEDFAGHIGCS
jgi:hypothetical protein